MRDIGHEQTDKLLAELEKKVAKEYQQAAKETKEKLDDYLRRFKIKDEIWRKNVAAGVRTQAEYDKWRIGQMAVGKRWEEMRVELAKDYHNANVIARRMIDGGRAEAYALNMNFTTYDIERAAGINTKFTLYSGEAVERIIKDNPELLPPPGKNMLARIAAGKDIAWQEGQIQSVMVQSILQGESIPNISKRIAQTLGESNHKSTIRYARTAVTGAENAGREDAYHRAEERGCNMMREWQSVHDNRTRHEHRLLDGQRRGIDEPFEAEGYEIMYPGDPAAAPEMIWNCRCRTRAIVAGLEPQARKYRDPTIEGMSYEEWLDAKPVSQSITHQEEVAEAMKRSYIRELYGGKGSGNTKAPDTSQPAPQQYPTIAGVERGEAMTHAEADTGRVNPHFSEGGGYRINCQSCVTTYEARLRGYDVEVVPNDKKHPMCEELSMNTRKAWKNADGSMAQFLIGSDNWTYEGRWEGERPTARRFERMLKDTLTEEGRYTVQFKWRGYNAAHIVNLQKDGDDLVIYDPQSNKLLRGKQVSSYLDEMAYKRDFRGNRYYQYPGVIRIDDKEINFDVANEIMRKVGST